MEIKSWVGIVVVMFLFNIHVFECRSIVDDPKNTQVPCYFIFGDSLADNGNNNILPTKAKVNYSPYGINFPYGPTGRFTNGRTTVDFIAELLGFKNQIPSFVATMDGSPNIVTGVNYASGSAGIRDETGKHLGISMDLDKQLLHHKIIVDRIAMQMGNNISAVDMYLNKCVYTVGIGNNDYLNNYFMRKFYPTSRRFTPEQYATALIDQYSQQLRRLHAYGARKVAVFAAGQLGCIPFSLAHFDTKGSFCVDEMNDIVNLFNKKLVVLVDQLNRDLPNAKFTFLNPEAPIAGFKVFEEGCCEVSDIGQCIPSRTPCPNSEEYVFWDAFHPTEAMNRVLANLSYNTIVTSYSISNI